MEETFMKTAHIYALLTVGIIGFAHQDIQAAASNGKTLVDSHELKIATFSPETVKQEEVDCGLHAVKNALAMYNYFTQQTKTKATFLDQLKKISVGNFPHMPACRFAVTGTDVSRYLGGDEVEAFAQLVGFSMNNLTILENISEPHYTQDERVKLAQLKEAINRNDPVVHAFVLGNMSEITGTLINTSGQEVTTTIGTMGHYIGAILVKMPNKPITFYIADSLGERPKQNIMLISRLNSLLASINPTNMKFAQIHDHFYDAFRYLNSEPNTTLRHIEQIALSAQRYNLFNQYFVDNYQRHLLNILVQIEPFLTPTNKTRLSRVYFALINPNNLRAYQPPTATLVMAKLTNVVQSSITADKPNFTPFDTIMLKICNQKSTPKSTPQKVISLPKPQAPAHKPVVSTSAKLPTQRKPQVSDEALALELALAESLKTAHVDETQKKAQQTHSMQRTQTRTRSSRGSTSAKLPAQRKTQASDEALALEFALAESLKTTHVLATHK